MAKFQHALFFPVYGLRITEKIGGEIKVGRVTFVRADKIPRIRKRLGLRNTISYYRSKLRSSGKHLFNIAPIYAHIHSKRERGDRDYSHELDLVREAFWVVASSFFCYEWRKDAILSLRPHPNPNVFDDSSSFGPNDIDCRMTISRRGPMQPNTADSNWRHIQRDYHFFDLLKILRGDRPVKDNWRKSLVRASVLCGQSFLAKHIAEAFMNDMIAIETLICSQGDKFPDAIIDRLVAIFGWLTGENRKPWEEKVARLYQLRCSYVHDGVAGDITGMDLHNADTLIQNLLRNLCRHTATISCKPDLIKFAERIDARKTLGQNPRRPVNIEYVQRALSSNVRKKINDVSAWSW